MILISGATADIGFAIASVRARERASVTTTGGTQQRVEEAVGKVRHEIADMQIRGIAADLAARGTKAHKLGNRPRHNAIIVHCKRSYRRRRPAPIEPER